MDTKLTLSLLFCLLLLFSSSVPTSASKCSTRDRKVLLAIYSHFGSPAALSSWRTPGVACCDWAGVDCYMSSNRVRNLDFNKLNISGTIPAAIGDFPLLQGLTMTNMPKLIGNIPSSFTNLKRLVFLDLSRNSLSGRIPAFLSEITSLTFLDLSYNKFSGSIPPSIPKLQVGALILSHNQLTGPIPDFSSFGDGNIFLQHNLIKFDMSHITFPVRLTQLELNNNYIYGSIPAQINEVTEFGLERFNVSYNLLCGKIPEGVVTQKFPIWNYFHNKCLCGKPLPPCK